MSPVERLVIGAIVVLSGVAGFTSGRALFRPEQRTLQPIAFNHQTHTQVLEIECGLCHEFYETSQHSGLPTLTVCLGCHEDALTEDPEEQKIRDLAAAGEDDVFRKLFRLPDHTFYSHRSHVAVGEIPCERCHGAVAETASPPEQPLIRITMEVCVDCHEAGGISTDCTRCHK